MCHMEVIQEDCAYLIIKKDMDNTGQPCSKEVSFEVQTINRIRFLGIRYF